MCGLVNNIYRGVFTENLLPMGWLLIEPNLSSFNCFWMFDPYLEINLV